ncbi:MAG: restriction endonuclease subunit S [Prevotellaceae bacterium]|jgi:type I restriction enzyme S subunit|nr:restriction endonuclease subunit S [Prevotellaceae bacterium]
MSESQNIEYKSSWRNEYLFMWLSRPEFDRYSRFHSWGSVREKFNYNDLCEVRIPIPKLEVQQSIVNIYNACQMRRDVNERLRAQIKDICRVLIRGSISIKN